MKEEPPPAATNNLSSAATTKSYEGVKHKGKVGSLIFTPTSLLFSASSQDISSWNWVAVKKHMIKSVSDSKHMVKLIFQDDAKDAPIILEVGTREQVEQIKADIAAARKRGTDANNATAKKSPGVSSHPEPSTINSNVSGTAPSKSSLAPKTAAPQSPKRVQDAVPGTYHQPPKKIGSKESQKKQLPSAPLPPKETPPKHAKPAAKKPTKIPSDGSSNAKASNISSSAPRSPKPGAHSVKSSSLPANAKTVGIPNEQEANDTASKPTKEHAKAGDTPNAKSSPGASLPGAHSVPSNNISPNSKTLEEDNLINEVIQERAALTRAQTHDGTAIAERTNTGRRKAVRRTQSFDPAVSSQDAAHQAPARIPRRARKRPAAASTTPPTGTLENDERLQARAAIERTRSRSRSPNRVASNRRRPAQQNNALRESMASPNSVMRAIEKEREYDNQMRSRSRSPARTIAAPQRPAPQSSNQLRSRSRSPARAISAATPRPAPQNSTRDSTASPNTVIRAIQKEREHDNQMRSRSRSPARTTSAPQRPAPQSRSRLPARATSAAQRPAPQNSTRDSMASPNAVIRAIQKERQYDNQRQSNQKKQSATPDGTNAVDGQPQQKTGEWQSEQPEQAQHRQSVAAASSTGSRPSVVETRPSQASTGTASSISLGSSHAELSPLPEPLPPRVNRRSTRRPGAQAIAGIGARRESSDLDLINEEDSGDDLVSPSPDILIEARLVEEASRADLGMSVVEAKPVPEDDEMGYREILKNRKARIGICVLLLFAVIIMTAVILALTLSSGGDGSNDNDAFASNGMIPVADSNGVVPVADSTVSADSKNNSSIPGGEATQETPLLPGVAPFLEHAFELQGLIIPDSTRQALGDPASPHWMAQEWLYKDPNLEEISPHRVIRRFALATLYHSTTGDKWDTNSLWLDYSAHECDWYFATPPCQLDYENFEELYLVGNNLAGTIPPEIFLLPLSILEVADNPKIRGALPAEIGFATELTHLALFNIQLQGSIPTQVGEMEKLNTLLISGNPSLKGSIPTEIGNMLSLHNLHILDTSISGTIPTELGLLPLNGILFGFNENLRGSIPTEFGLLTSLVSLFLQSNTGISGSIPSELGALTELVDANFQDTPLTGPIPPSLCRTAFVIGSLALSYEGTGLYCPNDAASSGTIPPGTNPENVDTIAQIGIDAYFKATFGSDIPESTAQALEDPTSPQAKAQAWLVRHQDLAAMHPERILQRFALATWYYSAGGENWKVNAGWLDHDVHECEWANEQAPLCSLPALGRVDQVDIFDNNLSGTIPPELFFLPHLQTLSLHVNNNLAGPIPSEIGFARNMDSLYIIESKLEGSIPTEIGKLTRLSIVQLLDNRSMRGPVPSEMGNIVGLEVLTLTNTGLTGSLPGELGSMGRLEELNVRENSGISGSVPPELGKVTTLKNVDFSGTSMSGPIPRVMCNNVDDLYYEDTQLHC